MANTTDRSEEILQAALSVGQRFGLASISARGVAKECGISVGTLYNYFPSCDELTAAVAARLFEDAFYEDFCNPKPHENYVSYCRRLLAALKTHMGSEGGNWMTQLRELSPGARKLGRVRMEKLVAHVQHGLVRVLEEDQRAKPQPQGPLNSTAIAAFTLSAIAEALRENDTCETAFALLEQALYQ